MTRRILVLGGGFAAYRLARDLKGSDYSVTLAAPHLSQGFGCVAVIGNVLQAANIMYSCLLIRVL